MTAIKVVWGESLRAEYQHLFDTCKVHPNRKALTEHITRKILANRAVYQNIAAQTNPLMPWWLVGVIHHMEANLSFDKHLHNGDPLAHRTTHVPAGRPVVGKPPFTFTESALDALKLKGFRMEKDFSIPHLLFLLEGYNGYGYRQYHPAVLSPYLWSFTGHYHKGKYVADGKFDGEAVSQQLGIAAVIRCGYDMGFF